MKTMRKFLLIVAGTLVLFVGVLLFLVTLPVNCIRRMMQKPFLTLPSYPIEYAYTLMEKATEEGEEE